MDNTQPITVETTVNESLEKVWKLWTTPADIMQWNNPTDEWHTPSVEIDLIDNGRFLFKMETKDGKKGFDHSGKYNKILIHQLIDYTTDDGRRSIISFTPTAGGTTIAETFEPERETPVEIQKDFCKKILNNFKKYTEAKK